MTEAAHGGSITGGYVARVSLGTVNVRSMLFQQGELHVSTDDSHGFVPDDNIMIFDIKEESGNFCISVATFRHKFFWP